MKALTPLKAIRAKCLECCAGNKAEIRGCPLDDCALWSFRFGRNPARKGIGGRAKIDSESCAPNSRCDPETNGRSRDRKSTEDTETQTQAKSQNNREGAKRYSPSVELDGGGS